MGPGEADLTYSTVLGSCISACVRDVRARIGGMNHFLLAEQSGSARDRYGASARYGAFAMERLINTILSRGTGSWEFDEAWESLSAPELMRPYVDRVLAIMGVAGQRSHEVANA